MNRTAWALAAALAVTLGASTARAQDAVGAGAPGEAVHGAEADRAYVRDVLSRDEVRAAARIAGADHAAALDGVAALDGDRLERATRQARAVDRALGEAANEQITLSATTIIIVLLLILVIIMAA